MTQSSGIIHSKFNKFHWIRVTKRMFYAPLWYKTKEYCASTASSAGNTIHRSIQALYQLPPIPPPSFNPKKMGGSVSVWGKGIESIWPKENEQMHSQLVRGYLGELQLALCIIACCRFTVAQQNLLQFCRTRSKCRLQWGPPWDKMCMVLLSFYRICLYILV